MLEPDGCLVSQDAEQNDLDALQGENVSLRRRIVDLTAAVSRLKETSEMYRIVADTASDSILCVDEDHDIIYANPSIQQLLGYAPASLIGRPLISLIPPQNRAHHLQAFQQFLESGEQTRSWSGLELEILHADGTLIPVDLSIGSLKTSQGTFRFTGFLRDSRPRKRLEEISRERLTALMHADRLKSAGELAAGLAHELNQPLSAICLHADLAVRLFGMSEQEPLVRESLEAISSQSQRAAGILNILRELIRKNEPVQTEFSLHAAILAVVQLMRGELNSRQITLQLQLCEDEPLILGDQIQIEQVMLNLLQNAQDAITAQEEGVRQIRITSRLLEEQIQIEVADSGIGLPEDSQSIFRNFFTTKQHGLGVGLGICQSIMQRHRGQILATTSPEGETLLVLSLPVRNTCRASSRDSSQGSLRGDV